MTHLELSLVGLWLTVLGWAVWLAVLLLQLFVEPARGPVEKEPAELPASHPDGGVLVPASQLLPRAHWIGDVGHRAEPYAWLLRNRNEVGQRAHRTGAACLRTQELPPREQLSGEEATRW